MLFRSHRVMVMMMKTMMMMIIMITCQSYVVFQSLWCYENNINTPSPHQPEVLPLRQKDSRIRGLHSFLPSLDGVCYSLEVQCSVNLLLDIH